MVLDGTRGRGREEHVLYGLQARLSLADGNHLGNLPKEAPAPLLYLLALLFLLHLLKVRLLRLLQGLAEFETVKPRSRSRSHRRASRAAGGKSLKHNPLAPVLALNPDALQKLQKLPSRDVPSVFGVLLGQDRPGVFQNRLRIILRVIGTDVQRLFRAVSIQGTPTEKTKGGANIPFTLPFQQIRRFHFHLLEHGVYSLQKLNVVNKRAVLGNGIPTRLHGRRLREVIDLCISQVAVQVLQSFTEFSQVYSGRALRIKPPEGFDQVVAPFGNLGTEVPQNHILPLLERSPFYDLHPEAV
mmetsp:Transcript_35921/g.101067  ORF Transcript_35921/g.101067 Transcript_35921/m.101067 type:complete len:299 (-) Transcript_35921:192-1088(-)